MEQIKILVYAKKNIEITASENNIQQVLLTTDSICLEMVSGKNYELSQREIEYQAALYLESELEDLKN